MKLNTLFGQLEERKIRLWVEDGQLRFRAKEGALTAELRNSITANRSEIIQFLQNLTSEERWEDWDLSPITADQFLPLSFSQQRLRFLDQLHLDNAAYNILTPLRMSGNLDVSVLKQSFSEIVRRHRVLQTVYLSEGNRQRQIIHADPVIPFSETDISAMNRDQQETMIQQAAKEEIQKEFDLERDIPIRVSLWRLNAKDVVLFVTLHHIAADAWSIDILTNELSELYTTFINGGGSPLAALPIQYHDFAYHQNEYFKGAVLENLLDYWTKSLEGAPTILKLPCDHPRPSIRSANGATIYFKIPEELSRNVLNFAEKEKITPFMVMLTAYQVLLYRYTNQSDISVGVPIAGRRHPLLENLIGFFVNTLVIRARFEECSSAKELLLQVRETMLGAYAHQDLPFEKLVEVLRPERRLDYTPLFQVMFNFYNTPWTELSLPDLTVAYLNLDKGTAKFDLNLAIEQIDGCFQGTMIYSTDLFEQETVERLTVHYQTLLADLVDNPDSGLEQLTLLAPSERDNLVYGRNQTTGIDPVVGSVIELIETQAAKNPQRIAVSYRDNEITYQQLNQKANRLAHFLIAKGVGPNQPVAILMEREPEIVIAILGVLKAGAGYVPIDSSYPDDRIRDVLEVSSAKLVLTQQSIKRRFDETIGRKMTALDVEWKPISTCCADNPQIRVNPRDLMYVIFTSGSTGKPKGVAVEHRSFLNYILSLIEACELGDGLQYAVVSTFAADLGNANIYGALCTGGRLHVIPYETAVDPPTLAAYFKAYPVDVMKLVPSHFEAMTSLPDPGDIIPRKRIIFAGEPCSWGTVKKVQNLRSHCIVENHYGPTETTVSALRYQICGQVTQPSESMVPIGKPFNNVTTYILDQNRQPVPSGVPGELYIGGAGVARGYLGQPDLTAESFVDDPFTPVADGKLYGTGDLTRYRNDGTIEFLGRKDDQIKIRGFRVEPAGIRAVLMTHEQIDDAVVLSRRNQRGNPLLTAYVAIGTGDSKQSETIGGIREYLKRKLPDYMVPHHFIPLETLPLTANGKVDLDALPEPGSQVGVEKRSLPETALEKEIADIWKDILGLEDIGATDNFFDIGGDSFKAIAVVSTLASKISVIDFFKHPTIAELASFLEKGKQSEDGMLHEMTRTVSRSAVKLSIIAVPYGGGSAIVYQPLAKHLPSAVALYALQVPGHDFAKADEERPSLKEVAKQCVDEIETGISGPVALYGHCVGGALAIEIARQAEDRNLPVTGLFMGGTFPFSRLPGRFFGLLAKLFPLDRWTSNRILFENLLALGGFTDVLEEKEKAFIMESMRQDIREAEDYYTAAYADQAHKKIKSPIITIVGERDRAVEFFEERFEEWDYFSDRVDLEIIPKAGHYFLKHQPGELSDILCHRLDRLIADDQALHLEAPDDPLPVQTRAFKDTEPKRSADTQTRTGTTTHGQQPGNVREKTDQAEPQPVAAPVPEKSTVADPNFGRFLLVAFSQFASMIGSALTSFALGVWVYQKTQSVTEFAYIVVFALLPGILLLPLAGALVDRWDRRLVMKYADAVAVCGSILVFSFYWFDQLQIWHIYIAVSLNSIADAFQRPAYIAAIAQLVPKRLLARANGLAQFAVSTGGVLAVLLGGFLFLAIGLKGVLLIDFAAFLFAFSILSIIRFPNRMFKKREEPVLKEIVGGWRYIIRRPELSAMVIFFVIFNFFFNSVDVMVTPLALSMGSTAVLGRILAADGIGRLVGGLIMALWGGTRRRAVGMIGFTIVVGISMIVAGIRPQPVFLMAGFFGIGLSVSFINSHWQALMQTKVGLDLLGRVLATNQMLAWSMIPIGFVIVGPLSDQVFEPFMTSGHRLAEMIGWLTGTGPGRGIGLLMVMLGLFLAIWGVLGLLYRPLRLMEDRLPDAIPNAVIEADKDVLQQLADKTLHSDNDDRQKVFK